jgi:O-antigen ligase
LIVFLVRDFLAGYRRDFRLSGLSVWWLGLIALGCWSALLGPYREISLYEVVRMAKCWILFLVIANECVREKHFHYAVIALMGAAAVNILIALIQFVLKRSLGLQALGEPSPEAILGANYGVYLSEGSAFRVGALLGHANLFAAYLALILPIFIGLLFTSYGRVMKLALTLVSVGGMVCLVMTLSRTAWAGMALALGTLGLFVTFHARLRFRYMSTKIAMLALIVAGGLAAAGPIITRLTASDPGALDFRYEWLGIAWRMVQANPFLGVGLNTFSYHILGFAPYGPAKLNDLFGPVWPVVHNIYLLVWSEQGTIGLVLFLALNLHVFWTGIRGARFWLSDRISMLCVGAMCGLSAILVDGLGSFFIRVPACGRMYWIVVGLVVASHYWNVRNAPLRLGTDQTPSRVVSSGQGRPVQVSRPGLSRSG